MTILSPITTTTAAPHPPTSMYNPVPHTNQVQFALPQQVTFANLSDKPIAPNVNNIAKPSPTKAGKIIEYGLATRVNRGTVIIQKFCYVK